MKIVTFNINQFKDQNSFFVNSQKYNLINIKNELKIYFVAFDQKIFNLKWKKESDSISDKFKSKIILISGKTAVSNTKYNYLFLAQIMKAIISNFFKGNIPEYFINMDFE